MKKNIIYTILITFILCAFFSCQANDSNNSSDYKDNAIVKVNGEYILKSEIDPVYQQYKETTVTYEKIINDTILEILVIQQADKYGITINNEELNNIIQEYKNQQLEFYEESLALYGETQLKKKLKDITLFNRTKKYVQDNIIIINDDLINSFKMQEGFKGHLNNNSNQDILKTLEKEIKQYAFSEWMEGLRKEADIIYY